MAVTFLSLGSGSCGNCYYIATDSDAVVIDCGISQRRFKKLMNEYGMSIGKVRAILITHDHADHIKAAGKMSKDFGWPIYATTAVHEGMDRNWQNTVKVPQENRRHIEPDKPFDIGPFHITAFPLPHDATENVGYHIQVGDCRFTVMTDVGDVTTEVRHYIEQSTHLVLEANYDEQMLENGPYPPMLKTRIACGTGHLSNRKTGLALANHCHADLKHVWLCHLSEENNTPSQALDTVKTTLATANITLAEDFAIDVLNRKVPTGPFLL